jgi:hypothetical protein
MIGGHPVLTAPWLELRKGMGPSARELSLWMRLGPRRQHRHSKSAQTHLPHTKVSQPTLTASSSTI